jgi:hypothetical protein
VVRFLTSGRRKWLETHLKRIAAKGIATEFAVYAPVEGVFGGKAAFRGKYTLFFGNKSRIFMKKKPN